MQLQQNMAKLNSQSNEQCEAIAQDPMKHIMTVIEKRVRNMDKRKVKLDGYRKMAAQGIALDPDQKAAVRKYNEVVGSLDFAKELIKTFSSLSVEVQKTKEQLKLKEEKLKEEEELKRSQFVASCLLLLKLLSSQVEVQEDFLKGENNAVEVEQSDLDLLLQFYGRCLKLTAEAGNNLLDETKETSEHLNRLYDASNATVCGSTYADIKSIFMKIWECDYFESFPDFTKVYQPEEKLDETGLEREDVGSSAELEHGSDDCVNPVQTGVEFTSQAVTQIEVVKLEVEEEQFEGLDVVDATPFVEQECSHADSVTETQTSFDQARNSDRNLIDTHLQQQNQVSFMSFQFEDTPGDAPAPVESTQQRPVHTIEEVLADVQGEYNFLQDSMLDFDNQGIKSGSSYTGQTNPPNEPTNNVVQDVATQQSTPFNNTRDPIEIDNAYHKSGPNLMPKDATNPPHPSANPTNKLYPSSAYADQEKTENYITNNNIDQQRLESQMKQPTDNLGMGQTTFGSNEQTFPSDMKSSSPAQYAGTLHSMESYQQHQELNMVKPVPETTYSTSPFSSLHGNSQSPFEGTLPGNAIPDPIPMPSSNPAMISQTLSTPDPPTTHIPFPNDKMSGYRSYNTSAPSGGSPSNAGIAAGQEDPTTPYAAIQEKQQQSTLLSSGDADHISPPGVKQDTTRNDDVIQEREPLKVTKEPLAPSIRANNGKTSSQPANQQLNRAHRLPHPMYQNFGQPQQNYNRGSMMPRLQNQNMGGFYNNRGGNHRPGHNRNPGNFDSMGHPKHFGGPVGGGYQQHPQQGSSIPPFNSQFNRQDNGMYGGGVQRRGGGGSNRGNKGYPRVNNVRNNNTGSNYNRSRTFRPQNPEQTA